jgi:hypothetical protein
MGAQAEAVTGIVVKVVILQCDRIVLVNPDDHALVVVPYLIVVEQLLQPIKAASIVEIEDFGIEHQMVVIIDATAPEVADDVVPDVSDASTIDHGHIAKDEGI